MTTLDSHRSALIMAAFSDTLAIDAAALPRLREGAFSRTKAKPIDTPMEYGAPGVAIVDIQGALSQTAVDYGWFAFDGYDAICARMQSALADPSVSAVVMRIDSPGGDVAGLFEAVRSIRAAATAANKPIVACANELAASAAYALACAADLIVVPDSGRVGSVGVIAVYADFSKALADDGVGVNVIMSGARKADGMSAIPMTTEARASLQANVDYLAGVFAGEVSQSRKMTVESVLALEAACPFGPAALAAGLADKIGNMSDAVAIAQKLATNRKPQGRSSAKAGVRLHMKTIFEALGLSDASTEADALAAVSRLQAELSRVQSDLRAVVAPTTKSDPAEALGVIEAWKAKSAHCDELEAKIEAQAKAADVKERESLIAFGRSKGRLSPTQISGDKAVVPSWSTATLRLFIETARDGSAVPIGEVKPPANTAENSSPAALVTADGKSWDQMTPRERGRLKTEDPELFKAMIAASEKA